MRKIEMRRERFQVLALVMGMIQVIAASPRAEASAAEHQEKKKSEPDARGKLARSSSSPPKVMVNRQVPKVEPPVAVPTFSASPTDEEIFAARVFEEPLVAMGATGPQENRELAQAIGSYLMAESREDVSAFEGFLRVHPESAWRAGLLSNLGTVYRRTGYFSRALVAWEKAWQLSRIESDMRAQAIADVTLGELLALKTRLGRTEEVAALLDEIKMRNVRGSAAEHVEEAKLSLWLMKNRPEKSFRCGPLALARVLALARGSEEPDPKIMAFPSTSEGTSLLQLRDLGLSVGLEVQMAKRSKGSEILLPSVAHWRAGHFAAVVRQEGGKYLIQDPTFAEDIWVSRAAMDVEGSGYFLTMRGPLPAGWEPVGDEDGGRVWGKGRPPNPDPKYQTCAELASGGNGCPSCSSSNNGPSASGGMPVYSLQFMMLNLHITDTPLAYSPPFGTNVSFEMTYNSRDSFQPGIFRYSNLGPKWTFNWLSYVQDDPSTPQADVTVYLRGGGAQLSTGYNPATSSYAPEFRSGAVIVRTSASPIRYERRLSDGSIEVFSQPDGVAAPRKVLLTSWLDPAGNAASLTYDASLRIVSVTDPIGQATTLFYDDSANPLRITRVQDPFGRSAGLQYNSSGELQQITDVIGMASQFTYATGDFVSQMTTPYGTTTFNKGYGFHSGVNGNDGGDFPTLQATDAMGGTEMMTYDVDDAPLGIPSQETLVPQGFSGYNNHPLWQETTFYWDKRAISLYPGDSNHPPDYTKAKSIHWLYNSYGGQISGIPHSVKMPLESRVWNAYPGQADTAGIGTGSKPSAVARVLDDGSSQVYRYEYNLKGRVTKSTDPVGRETDYFYGTNNVVDPDQTNGTGIDLLQVKQNNGTGHDLLASYFYDSLHDPLTITDAAGQTTTYTYNGRGQLRTVTTPPRAGITENRTTTYTYYPDTAATGAGRVQTITGPATGATTTYQYDSFGRVSQVSDSEGYALTTAYDALDRPTTVTYPDTTYERTVYDRLDIGSRRDRLGRWSRRFYDPLRHMVATRDPAGRTTIYKWCNCGSLDGIQDGNGNVTSWLRDVQGRVTKETRADQSFKTFVYENTTSRLLSVTDARTQTKTYGYGLDNHVTSTTYNSVVPTPTVSFAYDPVYDRIASMTDGTGQTTYSYNPITTSPALGAGQLASITGPLPSSTVTYAYDELGRVTTRGLSTFQTTSGYDALGRFASLASLMGNFSWTYVNTTGRPQTVTYPNAQTTTYSYFPNLGDQRLQEIKHQQTAGGTVLSQFDYTYEPVGNIKTWTQQRGTSQAKIYTLVYDLADQLSTATVTGPNPLPVPSRFRYAYDNAGSRTAEELDDAGTGAIYNKENQVSLRQPGGALLFRGTLNEPATVTVQGKTVQVASDNSFAAQVPVGSSTTNVVVAATDYSGNTRTNTYQVSESGLTTNYTYDSNGNVAGDGIRTYVWDGENRLTRVTQGATELARFTYDGQGRRAQKIAGGVTHSYIYDGANIIEERLSSVQTYDYVQRPGMDQPLAIRDQATVVSYYLADHLGSIVQTTSSTGTVTLTREYDPWGNALQGSATAGYSYTGREWDPETGLYYYRARYYDPKLGRFISEDPIGFDAGVNFYAYVEDNPVNATDPFGLAAGGNWKNNCGNAAPLSPKDPKACNYGGLKVNLGYVEWDLDCVCKNAGDDPGANCVRACIQCAKNSGEDVTRIDPHRWCKAQCRAKGSWTYENDKRLNDLINQKCARCWFQGR